jgi:cation-transporting ATPase E
VLADNDFSHMPEVVAEGRRSINNLQRSATLFLVKTVFSAVLTLVCIFLPPYPFIPIQMTLISSAIIGWPSFVLALQPNHDRVEGSFLVNVLRRSLPASLAIVFALLCVQVAERIVPFGFDEASTISTYLTGIIGITLIFLISRSVNPLRTALLASVVAILLYGTIWLRDFFVLAPMTQTMAIFTVGCGIVSEAMFIVLYNRLKKMQSDGKFAHFVEHAKEMFSKAK